jgi:hypothetical protein
MISSLKFNYIVRTIIVLYILELTTILKLSAVIDESISLLR